MLDDFIRVHTAERPAERVCFWKVSAATAELLAQRGYWIAPYGIENDIKLPRSDLSGTRMRGLRRQLDAARGNGLTVEPIPVSADVTAGVWHEMEAVTRAWLATRPRRREVRRVTRRVAPRHESHCTKVVARRRDGGIAGWAAMDHIYADNHLIGCGLSAVRYDPACGEGIASLLALDGAAVTLAEAIQNGVNTLPRDTQSDPPFRLALGESPLVAFPEKQGTFFGDSERRSRFIERIFKLVRERGRFVYGVRGIADWKSKWRADEQDVTFVAVDSALPLRASLATVALTVL